MHNICVFIKHSKTNGYLWPNRDKSNENVDFGKLRLLHNGLLLRVNPEVSIDTSKFLQVAFDDSHDQFVATDHLGKLYLFEIQANRYRLITRLSSQALCIVWNHHRPTKILLSLSDCTLCYLDLISKKYEKFIGHTNSALNIDIHCKGNLAISNSNHEAIIWDLQTCTQKQKLNINHETELTEAFFCGTDILLTCFKDNSIFIWDINTCECRTHLLPQNSTVGQYKTFAVSKSGIDLIAAGISSELHMWNLNLGTISKIIQLPSNIKGTKNIYLLENWAQNSLQVIALFSMDNFLYFIDITTATIILRVAGYDSALKKVVINKNCTYLTTILESGCLDLYDLRALVLRKDAEIVKITLPKPITDTDIRKTYCNGTRFKAVSNDERMLAGMDQNAEIEAEQADIKLDFTKLHSLLDTYGEYPERYRNLIWKFLLQLPDNKDSYSALERNGIHSYFNKLEDKFPLNNEKLTNKLKSVLSCLAFWSPLFGYVEYIPLFCFPFVKSISKNIQCFETIATILINWCGTWFDFFPCPPDNILRSVEKLIMHHDYALSQHFTKIQIEPQVYAWSILETSFSEIFNKNDWMRLWDHLISNHPSFMVCVCAAYSITTRQSLLSCKNVHDFEFFYHHQNPVSLKSVLKEAYRIQKETPLEIHPRHLMIDFRPLTKDTYPVFNKYPNYVVEYKLSEQEQFRKDEEEFEQLKKSTKELDEKLKKLNMEEKVCQQKLDSFKEIGNRRKQFLEKEEEQFALQRNKLLTLKHDMQLKELCILKTLRNKFSKEQELKWQQEIQQLQYKIDAKMKQHEQEISRAMSEVKDFQTFLVTEKQNLELEVEKLMNQATKPDHSIDYNKQPLQNYNLEEQFLKRNDEIKSVQAQYKELIKADQNELNYKYKTKTKLLNDKASEIKDDYIQKLTDLQQKNQCLEQEIENLTKNLITHKQKMPLNSSPKRDESLRAGVDPIPKRNAFSDAFSVRQKLAYNMRSKYS